VKQYTSFLSLKKSKILFKNFLKKRQIFSLLSAERECKYFFKMTSASAAIAIERESKIGERVQVCLQVNGYMGCILIAKFLRNSNSRVGFHFRERARTKLNFITEGSFLI